MKRSCRDKSHVLWVADIVVIVAACAFWFMPTMQEVRRTVALHAQVVGISRDLASGHYQEAAQEYEAILPSAHSPANLVARRAIEGLSYAFFVQREYEQALNPLLLWGRGAPGNCEVRRMLGVTYAHLGQRSDEATDILQRVTWECKLSDRQFDEVVTALDLIDFRKDEIQWTSIPLDRLVELYNSVDADMRDLIGPDIWATLPDNLDQVLVNETDSPKIRVLGYSLDLPRKEGEATGLNLYFECLDDLSTDYTIFLHGHVRGEDRSLLPEDRQQYGFANWGHAFQVPTSEWEPGNIYVDSYQLDANPGEYRLSFGFYRPADGSRLYIEGGGSEADSISLGWHAPGAPLDKDTIRAYTIDQLIDLHADLSRGTITTGDSAALLNAVNKQLLGENALRSYGPEEVLKIFQAIHQKRIMLDNPREALQLLQERADEIQWTSIPPDRLVELCYAAGAEGRDLIGPDLCAPPPDNLDQVLVDETDSPKIRVLGYSLDLPRKEGEATGLNLYFECLDDLSTDYTIFLHGHVKGEDRSLLPEDRQHLGFANWDHNPHVPTSEWEPGRIYVDSHQIQANSGEYRLSFGFYARQGDDTIRLFPQGSEESGIALGWHEIG